MVSIILKQQVLLFINVVVLYNLWLLYSQTYIEIYKKCYIYEEHIFTRIEVVEFLVDSKLCVNFIFWIEFQVKICSWNPVCILQKIVQITSLMMAEDNLLKHWCNAFKRKKTNFNAGCNLKNEYNLLNLQKLKRVPVYLFNYYNLPSWCIKYYWIVVM